MVQRSKLADRPNTESLLCQTHWVILYLNARNPVITSQRASSSVPFVVRGVIWGIRSHSSDPVTLLRHLSGWRHRDQSLQIEFLCCTIPVFVWGNSQTKEWGAPMLATHSCCSPTVLLCLWLSLMGSTSVLSLYRGIILRFQQTRFSDCLVNRRLQWCSFSFRLVYISEESTKIISHNSQFQNVTALVSFVNLAQYWVFWEEGT